MRRVLRKRCQVRTIPWRLPSADWLRRHCLRQAESGLLLPKLSIFSDGEDVCLDWQADPPDSYPRMPAEFTQSGRIWLSREDVDVGMRLFVQAVLERIGESDEDRVDWLRDNWDAIATADEEESSFCQSAGRLGLDPYLWHDWDPAVVQFLESGMGEDENRPIAADFLEAINNLTGMSEAWQWVRSARIAFDVEGSPTAVNGQLLQTTATAQEIQGADLRGVILSGGPGRYWRPGPRTWTRPSWSWACRCWGSATASSSGPQRRAASSTAPPAGSTARPPSRCRTRTASCSRAWSPSSRCG